jgi:hypothetical protein
MVLVTPHSDHPDPLVKKLLCGVTDLIIDVQRECTLQKNVIVFPIPSQDVTN